MLGSARTQHNYIRNVIGIGQVWQHRGPEYCIQIKQIHRADRLVEAWFDVAAGRESHGVTFADLGRAYELVEEPDGQP